MWYTRARHSSRIFSLSLSHSMLDRMYHEFVYISLLLLGVALLLLLLFIHFSFLCIFWVLVVDLVLNAMKLILITIFYPFHYLQFKKAKLYIIGNTHTVRPHSSLISYQSLAWIIPIYFFLFSSGFFFVEILFSIRVYMVRSCCFDIHLKHNWQHSSRSTVCKYTRRTNFGIAFCTTQHSNILVVCQIFIIVFQSTPIRAKEIQFHVSSRARARTHM